MLEISYATGILMHASKVVRTSLNAFNRRMHLMPRQNAQVC